MIFMDKVEIIAISVALAVVAVRIYQKYIKKGADKPGAGSKKSSGSAFSSSSENDEYEPYSRK